MRMTDARCNYCCRISGWYRTDSTESGWVCDACRNDPLKEPVQERAEWNRELRKAYILVAAGIAYGLYRLLFE